jgi:hypothetical protein
MTPFAPCLNSTEEKATRSNLLLLAVLSARVASTDTVPRLAGSPRPEPPPSPPGSTCMLTEHCLRACPSRPCTVLREEEKGTHCRSSSSTKEWEDSSWRMRESCSKTISVHSLDQMKKHRSMQS